MYSDEYFMHQALMLAQRAFDQDEVPVGAIVVSNNKIIGRGYNLTQRLTDPTAHAEMQAFTAACSYLNGKYLDSCTLYVTLEPCCMCAGAAYWTQINRIVVGARDDKRGFTTFSQEMLHPKTQIEFGLLQTECSALLTSFFSKKRKINN